jgi:hypothetical protein
MNPLRWLKAIALRIRARRAAKLARYIEHERHAGGASDPYNHMYR